MRRASIALLTSAAVLGSCASTPSRPSAARVVVLQSRQLSIHAVRAEDRATSLLVRGRISRRGMATGPVWGNLHLEFRGTRGVLACKDTSWSQLGRRGRPASFFSTAIQARPAQVEEISISHETIPHRPCPVGTLND